MIVLLPVFCKGFATSRHKTFACSSWKGQFFGPVLLLINSLVQCSTFRICLLSRIMPKKKKTSAAELQWRGKKIQFTHMWFSELTKCQKTFCFCWYKIVAPIPTSLPSVSWSASVLPVLEKTSPPCGFRYFEGGVSSVYLWDLDHGFAGVILIKKAGDGSKKIKGCWDSIHVVEVQVSNLICCK